MPSNQSMLHVPRPLEDFVLAYMANPEDYLFGKALPKKPVRHKSDAIRKESKGALLQNYDLTIGPSGAFPQIGFEMDASSTYLTQPYGVQVALIDDDRANADSEIEYDQRQCKFGMQAILTRFEFIAIKQKLRASASYGSNTITLGPNPGGGAGPRQWTNVTSLKSNPYNDWLFACGQVENVTGKRPNFIGLHARVWDCIITHPAVISRAARENGQGAAMTVELWEKILRLAPGTIQITAAFYNTAATGTPDYRSFIGPDVLFAYNEPGSLNSQGLGQTFWFTGPQKYSGQTRYGMDGEDLSPAGEVVVQSYAAPWEGKGATMIKIHGEWDMKILNSEAGFLLRNCVDVEDPVFLGSLILYN